MGEKENINEGILYDEFVEMVPENQLPISREGIADLNNNKMKWYFDLGAYEKPLIEKYGELVVKSTKLHHLLNGSTLSYDEWVSSPDDTDQGELLNFANQHLTKKEIAA